MFKRIVLTGSLVLAIALVIPAHADTIYSAVLLGSNEVPPTGSPATGVGIFTLSGNLLTIAETFTGLTAPASAAQKDPRLEQNDREASAANHRRRLFFASPQRLNEPANVLQRTQPIYLHLQ